MKDSDQHVETGRSARGRTTLCRSVAPFWLLVALCLCTLARAPGFAAEELRNRGGSLRANPPQMRSLDLQPVGPGAFRVIVDYAKDPRLGPQLTLRLAQGPVTFTRRADGRYVGEIQLTAEQSMAFAERDEKLKRLGPLAVHNIYEGRVAVGSAVAVAPLNLVTARSGAQTPDSSGSVVPVPVGYLAVGALMPDPKSVLMITDRTVVADSTRTWDPCAPSSGTKSGNWTFGHLMKALSGSADASKLTADWLTHWSTVQTVNGVTVKPRPLIKDVVDNWPHVGTALDLDQAPFRLLAIVNRVDLAENLTFPADGGVAAGPGSAGEMRFVFDVAPQQTVAGKTECAVKRFQVIFEYQIPAADCDDVKAWAARWIALGDLERGSPQFNLALEKITEDVVTGKTGHLAQIRTNEIDLAESIGGSTLWEMREFELVGQKLEERTVRRTPRDTLNKTEELSNWVNANAADIKKLVHEVTGAKAGANPQMDRDAFWDGARGTGKAVITDAEVRYAFSLNTCTGCHARETCTAFNHVIPNAPGMEAGLSHFLTGGQVVPDPFSCRNESCSATPASFCSPGAPASCCREFNDLARRQQVIDQLTFCTLPSYFIPLNADH